MARQLSKQFQRSRMTQDDMQKRWYPPDWPEAIKALMECREFLKSSEIPYYKPVTELGWAGEAEDFASNELENFAEACGLDDRDGFFADIAGVGRVVFLPERALREAGMLLAPFRSDTMACSVQQSGTDDFVRVRSASG